MGTEDNSISFDAIGKLSFSSTTLDKHNKQEVKFMYGQLLKYNLTKISYSAVDMDNMIKFFQSKCKNQSKDIENIKEFRDNYTSGTSIWCYTNYVFLYTALNLALRTCNLDALCTMGIFIKDLHRQIVQLHKSNKVSKILMLYRGVVMPTSDFEEIKKKEGGLLSINSFLSTSSVKDVAGIFGSGASHDSTSVLLEITIDQFKSTNVSYASIKGLSQYTDEEEYLFTMGSVFRIESVEQLDGNAKWCVHLILTTDHDPELSLLTDYIQSQMQQPDLSTLCSLMLYMGEFEKIVEISEAVIKNPNRTSDLGQFYHVLGSAYSAMGLYQQALDKFELALDYSRERSNSEELSLSNYITKSLILLQQGKSDLALVNIQAAIQNVHESPNTMSHQEALELCNLLMGTIFHNQGHFEDALVYQKKAYNMAKNCLPSTHPVISECLGPLAITYMSNGQEDEALICIQESMKIQQASLLPEHVSAVCSQGTYAAVRRVRGDRSLSESINGCLSTTLLK
jgi:lipopolysaccharide biosynthesis regulator YciM